MGRDVVERDERALLALEVEVIHGLGPVAKGGLPTVTDPAVQAVLAWSPRARVLALGEGVAPPSDGGGFGVDGEPYAPGEPPGVLVRLASALTAAGEPAAVEGGPCFTFPDPLAAAPAAPLPLLLSDDQGRDAARQLTRPDNWQPGEWAELISGAAGEWAMAVHDGAPVSICHTPAANARAAEAGIWTRPDFRGRGLAPAAAAAWSHRVRRDKEVLFYSTTAANRASRSVARALGLAPLGWIWTVR
ncbi:GNAT family N-acetyltransferase [Streptomyces sp. NPDC041068]|uniref:GNAT family N-acetyltransferase n=1 Tax=Streptomyces sp. NPDC041068 TaxID=3155130 RepID=UPI0033DD345F